MKTRFLVLFLILIVFVCLAGREAFSQGAFQKRTKEIRKDNVPAEKADEEVGRVIFSLGFSVGSFGADPCQSAAGHRWQSKIDIKSASEFTGLPGKPKTNIGKTSQISEGGETYPQEEGENICIESRDSNGNQCVVATANEDGSVTFENKSESPCAVQLGEDHVMRLARKTEVTLDPPKEKTTGEKILGTVGKIWKETREIFGIEPEPSPPRTKPAVAGDRGQCDPYGVTGGCRVDKGSAWVIPNWMHPMDKLREAEAKGWVEKLTVYRINPSPESSGYSGGPKPAKTYPGESTKSGYSREKESKTQKGETIINPSGEKRGLSTRSFDLCGTHLPTPQEMTAMKLDPSHIVDPVESSWIGRIEQIGQERSLTWSKSVKTKDGASVLIERRYTNGNISLIKCTFYDRSGKLAGTINYNAKGRSIVGKRID